MAKGDEVGAPRTSYTLADIKRNLHTFLYRFFQTSQFKRSCVPNSPKVGSGGSLSPRSDWRAPTDAESRAWLDDLLQVPDIPISATSSDTIFCAR